MGKSILELFKTKPIGPGGETAEVVYDIRDSKDIRVSSRNLLVDVTGMAAARGLRKTNLSFRLQENLLEEETTGIRVIRAASSIPLYGTEISRILLRSTPDLDAMKTAIGGTPDQGLLRKALTGFRTKVNSKLGMPSNPTPTFVASDSRISNPEVQDKMIYLAQIRNSSEGSIFGQFLKRAGGSSLNNLGRNLLGTAIQLGKEKLRTAIFGAFRVKKNTNAPTGTTLVSDDISTTPFLESSIKLRGTQNSNYGNKDAALIVDNNVGGMRYSSKFNINKGAIEVKDRNDLSTKQQVYVDDSKYSSTENINVNADNLKDRNDLSFELDSRTKGIAPSILNEKGLKADSQFTNYSTNGENTGRPEVSPESQLGQRNDLSDSLQNFKIGKSQTELNDAGVLSDSQIKKYSGNNSDTGRPLVSLNLPAGQRNDLSDKLSEVKKQTPAPNQLFEKGIRSDINLAPYSDKVSPAKKLSSRGVSMGRIAGPSSVKNTAGSQVNTNIPPSSTGVPVKPLPYGGDDINKGFNTQLNDFINFRIQSVADSKIVQFRATITGLTETMSPSWDSSKFVGGVFNYYTYSGIERSVSFNFKVFSMNEEEHAMAWKKLNFLTSLTYPISYSTAGYITPPFVKLTLGDMYKSKEAYIENLTYTIDDNTPWEIEIKDGKLPTLVDVTIGFKFVESRGTSSDRTFYSTQTVT